MNENSKSIVSAIRRLDDDDYKKRAQALEELKAARSSATWHLIQAAYQAGEKTRHGALRALVEIADPNAADLYVDTLEDEDSDCRWLAAEGLAALGEVGLKRVLTLLMEVPRSNTSLRSLHHALSELEKAGFERFTAPVLHAYQSSVSAVELPTAAHKALDELRTHGGHHADS